MTMYEDHTAGASLFTDRRHAAFRRTIGHGLLRALGDAAFGKDKVASENLIVSCNTGNQDELRSHAHTVSPCICMCVFSVDDALNLLSFQCTSYLSVKD